MRGKKTKTIRLVTYMHPDEDNEEDLFTKFCKVLTAAEIVDADRQTYLRFIFFTGLDQAFAEVREWVEKRQNNEEAQPRCNSYGSASIRKRINLFLMPEENSQHKRIIDTWNSMDKDVRQVWVRTALIRGWEKDGGVLLKVLTGV